ncbi:RNA polymerase sigma factor [Desulfosoma caldarium]|uniref:RNA polymerase RpoE-like sigma-24 subunit n=1 Tax=Desulfosoma caldarium TaxID=610254 RepID=A0A3N1UXC4_9BACT|nr:sigma-70 family RNA polymerase sigma factor [Desulfosoma caldarium]ROQ93177.1 RNA polymerase RpoE-like sigma-24 subunit [Desulfosoma caldarium]
MTHSFHVPADEPLVAQASNKADGGNDSAVEPGDEWHLVRRAQAGDADAMDAIIAAYQHMVFTVAYPLCGFDRDEAMDVTQETFIQVFRKIGQFEGRSSLGAWIRRIAINASRLALKRKNRRLQFILPWRFFKNKENEERPLDLPGNSDGAALKDPLETLSTKELTRDVGKAMEGLSEKQRTVFVLKVFEEMTIAEIAETTGMALGTVKTHLFRATRTVRDRMMAMGYGEDGQGMTP